jgi:hypothetical protein
MCVLPWPGLVITKLHSTSNFFFFIINSCATVCMSVPPIPHVVAPCFVWPFSHLSLSLPSVWFHSFSLLPMSFYQRIMSACVSFHLVNADDSAPTPIFIFKWRSFIFGLLGGWNKYHALRKLNHLFHELTSTKMCDPLISMCDKRIFSSKLYCHQRLKLDLGFFEWGSQSAV